MPLTGTDLNKLHSNSHQLEFPTEEDNVEVRDIRGLLGQLYIYVVVQWMPGHAGLVGNE